ncbi:hypothetical protein [Streptomyces hypolithicus]
MAGMQRGFVHTIAWSLATGAAVTLSWWGVHTVMSGTAYDPPKALPIPSDLPARGTTAQGPKPRSSATGPARKKPSAASPTRSASPSDAGKGGDSASPGRTPSKPPKAPRSPSGAGGAATGRAGAAGTVKSYGTGGGRATFDLGKSSATLVSATPATGWSMQVWTTPTWIRVEFTSGTAKVSVFCTWHDHAPSVEIVDS